MSKYEPSPEFVKKLKFARTRMVASQPFYATLLMNAHTTEIPNVTGSPQETAFTDGNRIYFYRDFAKRITREEFTFVLIHEVMHMALQHVPRMKASGYHPLVWNYATDYVINAALKPLERSAENGVKLLPDCLYDPQYENMSADEVYRRLMEELPQDVKDALQQQYDGFTGPDGQPIKGQGNGAGNQDRTPDLSKYGLPKNPWSGDMRPGTATNEQLQKQANEWKHVMTQAAQQARMQGKLPAGIERHINELLYPKVDWRLLLHEFVQQHPADYAWHIHDRRFSDSRYIIPSLHGERLEFVVAVDTSGSFTEEQLRETLSEVYNIITSFDFVQLTVISCDAAIQTVTEVHGRNDLQEVRLKGGGGTDFRPVFDYIAEHKSNVTGLIYFTDLMGTFPAEAPSYPVLWIANRAHSLAVPFGTAIEY